MKLKPEERKQALLLGSLTAVVFVVGGVNIYRQLQKPAPGNGSPTTVTPASETTPNTAGISGLSAPATYTPTEMMAGHGGKMDMYADNPPEANGSRDPFTRIDAEPDPDASAQRFARNTTPINTHPISVAPQPHPTVLPGDLTPRTSDIQSWQPSAAAQKQLEEMTLAGVISGPSSVAVIHLGDRSYQLGDGEKLPNNISLVRVTDTGVYLKQGSQLLFLEIGKTFHTALPVKAIALPQSSAPSSEPGGMLQSSEPAPSRSETTPEREGPMQVTVNTPSDN